MCLIRNVCGVNVIGSLRICVVRGSTHLAIHTLSLAHCGNSRRVVNYAFNYCCCLSVAGLLRHSEWSSVRPVFVIRTDRTYCIL
jgi:hypothetical protein